MIKLIQIQIKHALDMNRIAWLILILVPNLCSAQRGSFGLELLPTVHFLDSDTKHFTAAPFSSGVTANALYAYDLKSRLQGVVGLGISTNRYSFRDYWPATPCDYLGNGTGDPFSSFFVVGHNAIAFSPSIALKFKYTNAVNHIYNRIGFRSQIILSEKAQLWSSFCDDCQKTEPLQPIVFNKTSNLVFFGIGYETRINAKTKMNIEPRVAYSLNNHFGDNSGNLSVKPPDKSRVIELSLSIGLNFR